MIKRVYVVLILILLIPITLFAESSSDFTLIFEPNNPETSLFEIGFASNSVNEITSTPSSKKEIVLSGSNEETYGGQVYFTATDDSTWVYWKIVSPSKLRLSVGKYNDKLTAERTLSDEGDVVEVSSIDSSAGIEWTVFQYTENMEESYWPETSNITLEESENHNPLNRKGYQAAGSLRFVVKARFPRESLLNYRKASYNGYVMAKVEVI